VRARLIHVLVFALVVAMMVPAVPAAGQQVEDEPSLREQLQALGKQFVPKRRPSAAVRQGDAPARGANPWLSLLSPAQFDSVDRGYWRQVAEARGEQLAQQRLQTLADDEFLVDEREPDAVRGRNDTQATAQWIRRLGTGEGDRSQAKILGTLAPWTTRPIGPFEEDDGAIPLANETGAEDGEAVIAEGQIGDGPHGSGGDGSGDFDHYALRDLSEGDEVIVDVDTPAPGLDSVLVVYDSEGGAIAFNDDDGESFDSLLAFTVPADGDYFVAIEGCCTFQQDPFDSGSGIGVDTEGPYTVTMARNASESDFYSFDLEAGDVVSAKVDGAAHNIRLFAPDGTEVMGSAQDFSFIYPMETQLTGGGNAVLDHVAAEDGRFALRVGAGEGNYEATVRVLRPGYEQQANAVQTLFLDFDGEEVNTGIWGGPGVRQLSPLSAFLSRWGLSAADEDAVIARTVAVVRENVRTDLLRRGANPAFDVRVRHSRSHRDRFGSDNVSRVIVGGTIEESGVPTIGIAQSIDPGNFEGEETALVLLDILSEPAGSEIAGEATLNHYIRPESDVVAFVGQALGNIIAHEIGHYIGNWHVDQFNDTTDLMDAGGGDFGRMFGVGPDRIGGTADDTDVDFGQDIFNRQEGFTGLEDTLNRSAFGLTGDITP
jgi:hypothetical protein